MSQSVDPDNFFQTDDAIAKQERRATKAQNNQNGRPISFTSKPLALILDPSDRNFAFVALSAGEARRIDLEARSISPPYRRPDSSGPVTPLTSLAFLPGSSSGSSEQPPTVFAGSWSARIYAWHARTRALLFTLDGGHTDFVKTLLLFTLPAVSTTAPTTPPRPLLASAGADTRLVLWDAAVRSADAPPAAPLATALGHHRAVLALAVDPFPRHASGGDIAVHLFSASSDREIRRWRIARSDADGSAGGAVRATSDPFAEPLRPHHTSVTALAFGPTGDLWSASADGRACRLARPDDDDDDDGNVAATTTSAAAADPKAGVARGEGSWRADTELVHGAANPVRTLAVAPDGRMVATGCRDEDIWVWNAAEGTVCGRFVGHADEVTAVVLGQGLQGWRAVSAALDGTVRTWAWDDLETGEEMAGGEGAGDKEVEGVAEGVQLTAEEEAELAALMEDDE